MVITIIKMKEYKMFSKIRWVVKLGEYHKLKLIKTYVELW